MDREGEEGEATKDEEEDREVTKEDREKAQDEEMEGEEEESVCCMSDTVASFDYSDMDSSMLQKLPNTSSSSNEFEFPPQVPPLPSFLVEGGKEEGETVPSPSLSPPPSPPSPMECAPVQEVMMAVPTAHILSAPPPPPPSLTVNVGASERREQVEDGERVRREEEEEEEEEGEEERTQRALEEAFQQLDRSSSWEGEESVQEGREVERSVEEEEEGSVQEEREEEDKFSHLYSKVDMSKKREERQRRALNGEGDRKEREEEVEDNVSVLYAKVDKTKKWLQRVRREGGKEDGESVTAQDGRLFSHVPLKERPPPALPPEAGFERPFSGDYEEVAVGNGAQSPPSLPPSMDLDGYAEVTLSERGMTREGAGYEVGYKGQGSLLKLCRVFGPEFSHISGDERPNRAHETPPLPEGRRLVQVFLLNGKCLSFTVGAESTVHELFSQVTSHLSLRETHLFGLAVRQGMCAPDSPSPLFSLLFCTFIYPPHLLSAQWLATFTLPLAIIIITLIRLSCLGSSVGRTSAS